jgi:diacylglycerol kinase family enzyme
MAVRPDEGVEALARGERPKRMLVIINPVATKMSERVRSLVVYALQGRYDVTTRQTDAKGHAISLCRDAAAEGFDVVCAFGGDGTVNEAANGLAATSTALTVLPGGSNNVVAKLLGIPTDLVDATEHILSLADRWEPRKVDLGIVNGRYFTFAAGMGLDASVVERVDRNPRLKKRFGPFYFVECAIVTFLRKYVVDPPRLLVSVDGREVGGVSLFIQNAENYTYFNDRPVPLVEGARFDSGCLAGVVLTRARPYDVPTVTFRALSGAARIAKHRGIDAFGAFGEAVVRSADDRAIPIQVDGDHISDELEARFSIAAGALTVIA